MSETSVPSAFLRDLDGIDDPLISRLLAMIVSLGGEVFVLKAELERLKRSLAERGSIDEAGLERMRHAPAFASWMAEEERSFARQLLDPLARERDVARPGRDSGDTR